MSETIQQLIARMRKFDEPFNAPATPEQIAMLEKALNIDALDDDLRALYLDHNGIPEYKNRHLMRLMPVDEVAKLAHVVEDREITNDTLPLFWTDDNSNYAGVYLSGVLSGKVFFLNHDTLDANFVPRFRSVRDFLIMMLRPGSHFHNMPTDYPLFQEMPETDTEDLALAEHFIRLYEQTPNDKRGDRRRHFAECAMSLLPFSASDKLLLFMQDDDMWIPERACVLAGQRKYLPAIPALGKVVRKGRSNGDYAAIRALLSMGDEARAELRRAKQEMPPQKLYLLDNVDLS